MSQRATASGGGIVQPKRTDTEGEYELTLDEDEDFCITVVLAIAEIRGIDPVEMPPLYDVQNPDEVNEMVSFITSSEDVAVEPVTFEFYEHDVTVDTDGNVTIQAA